MLYINGFEYFYLFINQTSLSSSGTAWSDCSAARPGHGSAKFFDTLTAAKRKRPFALTTNNFQVTIFITTAGAYRIRVCVHPIELIDSCLLRPPRVFYHDRRAVLSSGVSKNFALYPRPSVTQAAQPSVVASFGKSIHFLRIHIQYRHNGRSYRG